MLVVRGASSTDDLGRLGLPLAERYQRADYVLLVPDDAPARAVKTPAGSPVDVTFVDADGRMSAVALILAEVRDAYVAKYPRSDHMAHIQVGMFLFYWVVDEPEHRVVIDALSDGDVAAVRAAATHFVESNFGLEAAFSASLYDQDDLGRGPGTSRPESPADAVPSSPGSGLH